ncbi:MAG: polysaccharide biosynthesis protein, partial [Crocinitomicaceae bacterium]|nr:polysaccharide biosynthesis protein [Crocinitomicaceae bacterium]
MNKISTPRWVIILIDFLLNCFALLFAYLIRFDLKANNELFEKEWEQLSKSILFYFAVKVLVFYWFKIHKGLVRFTSTEDLRRIFIAVLTCSSIFLIGSLIRFNIDGYFLFPMSVLMMEFLASFAFTIGSRFVIKLIYLESIKNKEVKENVVIYGAGVSGLLTKRTIEKDRLINQNIVAFLDENKKLDGNRLEGVKIHSIQKLEKLHNEIHIDNIIVAVQNPIKENINNLVEQCLELDISLKKVPRPQSWINGEFSAKQLSKIKIEDLLGRKPIDLNQDKISQELENKVILITGAAGSIGSGLVKQIATYKPKLLVLLDQSESPLYN